MNSSPGIFNVLDPWDSSSPMGMVANDTSYAGHNAQVLQAIINIAQNSSMTKCLSGTVDALAATILFPGNNNVPPPVGSGLPASAGARYYIAVPTAGASPAAVVVDACKWPLKFVGTGNVEVTMVDAGNGFGDMFLIATNSGDDDNIGGVTFEDLRFTYVGAASGSVFSAIHVAAKGTNDSPNDGGQNVRINRCVFIDCPIGVWLEKALQPIIDDCTVEFDSIFGTAVQIGGPNNGIASKPPACIEGHIVNSIFRVGSGGPAGSTGLVIISAEHLRVDNIRMDSFSNGIKIVPKAGYNVSKCHFSNVSCYVGQLPGGSDLIGISLLIQTDDTDANPTNISQLIFEGCTFEPGDSNLSAAGGAGGIVIDEVANTTIQNIRFISCYSCRFPAPGMSITGGQDIEILGGMYSANNLGVSSRSYGIYASGTNRLRIGGVSCVGKYPWITLFFNAGTHLLTEQNVGIYIDGGCSDVIIEACDVTVNAQNGIVIDGTTTAVTDIFVRNCNATNYGSYSTAISVLGPGLSPVI